MTTATVPDTSGHRARNCGRGVVLGKRALFCNDFPGITEFVLNFPILNFEVRTGLFE